MLAQNVELVDIDGGHVANWLDLLVPPRVTAGAGWAAIILDGGAPIQAVVGGRGALDLAEVPYTGTSAAQLERLAGQLGVDAVIAVERAVIPELCAAIDRGLDMDADFVAQVLVYVRELKRLSGRGLWVEPALLDLIPPVTYDPLQRTFDVLVPDRTSLAAYVFEGRELYASVIAVKRHGDIELATTHLALEDELGRRELARDWRRQYRRLLQIIARRYQPPSLALFMERSAFYRIAAGPTDQLAREINAGHVILDPAPAWLLGLVGGATMAAVAGRSAKALARFLPPSARQVASSLAQTAQTVMRDSAATPAALLGFDPVELWLRVRHLYRAEDQTD